MAHLKSRRQPFYTDTEPYRPTIATALNFTHLTWHGPDAASNFPSPNLSQTLKAALLLLGTTGAKLRSLPAHPHNKPVWQAGNPALQRADPPKPNRQKQVSCLAGRPLLGMPLLLLQGMPLVHHMHIALL